MSQVNEVSEVLVPDVTGVSEIRHWLDDHQLHVIDDYQFLGRSAGNKLLFRFSKKQPAMLFKLTFGG